MRAAAIMMPLVLASSCVPPSAVSDGVNPVVSAIVDVEPAPVHALPTQFPGLLVKPSAAPAAPFVDTAPSEADRDRSLDCLTAAIYYEARSESEDGQRAVAQVVLNRVRHPAFPSSVCGVVYQGSHRRTGCQFSFTCDGSMRRPRVAWAWERARSLAAEALAGAVYAPVGNATHYHTRAIYPYWAPSLRQAAIVGAHVFYRWRGRAGEASSFRQAYQGYESGNSQSSSASSEMVASVAIHRGTSSIAAATADQVEVEGATVRIHRGGVQAEPQASAVQREVKLADDHGVRVHIGSMPGASGN